MKLFENTSGNTFKLNDILDGLPPYSERLNYITETTNSILFEFPLKVPHMKFDMEDNGLNYNITTRMKEVGKNIGNYKDYDIYQLEEGGYFKDTFINGDMTGVMFIYQLKKNVMWERVIWQHTLNYGMCREILFNYYLEKYNGIISDELHSAAAEKCWKKMFRTALDKGYKLFVVDEKEHKFEPVTVENMDDYYSLLSGKANQFKFAIVKT
jgi:hypothetical protein